MRITAKQAAITAASFVLTFALLWLALKAYQQWWVAPPLLQAINRVPGVQRVVMRSSREVAVALRPGADLAQVYAGVTRAAQAAGQPRVQLSLVAPTNPALERLAQEAALAAAQGIATGQYLAMAQNIRQAARRAGAEAQVDVGDQAVFVTFRQGTAREYLVVPARAYLSPVIARPATEGGSRP